MAEIALLMLKMEGNAEQRVLSIIPSKGKAGFNILLALVQAEVMSHDDSPTFEC